MNKKYRFRYKYDGSPIIHVEDVVAVGPISAINQFHSWMQKHREVSADRRTVLRPMLKHTQYRVVSVHHIYHDASLHREPSAQPLVESSIDYPKSGNPDLSDDFKRGLAQVVGRSPSHPEFSF